MAEFDFDRLTRGTQSTGPASEATLSELKAIMEDRFGQKSRKSESAQIDKTTKKLQSLDFASEKVRKSYLDVEEAAEKTTKSSVAFNSILRNLRYTGVLSIESIGDVGETVARFGDKFGPLGELVAEGLGKFIKMLEESIQVYRATNQVGAVFGANLNEIRYAAGETGLSLSTLRDFTIQASRALALAEGNVTEGLVQIRRTLRGPEFMETRTQLSALGFSLRDITSGLGDYLEIQSEIGRAQRVSTSQLVMESGEFLKNIDLLSKATGMQRQQILDQMKADSRDDRLKLLMGGLADGGREITSLTSVLQNVSPELANNVKDLIANMGIPQNAAQAGLIANSNIQNLLMKLTRGEGSAAEVIGEFQRLGAQTEGLSQQQRSLFTLYNQQGQGFYNYNIQLANGSKVFTKFLQSQQLQNEQIDKNREGSAQFDQAMEKLRARFQAVFTPVLDFFDSLLGVAGTMIDGFADSLEDANKGLVAIGGIILGSGGLYFAFKGLAAVVGKLSGVMKLLPGVGNMGKFGAGIGSVGKGLGVGGAGLAKGGLLAGVGVGGFAALAGGGIALGIMAVGKSLNVFAEGLERVSAVDGNNLKSVAEGTKSLSSAIVSLGGAQLVGGYSGFWGKLFGGGTDNFAKNINSMLEKLDKDKIDMYANSLKNLGESFASLKSGMTTATTGASKSTGDKLDQLNTTMEAILTVLDENTRYAKTTSNRDFMDAV